MEEIIFRAVDVTIPEKEKRLVPFQELIRCKDCKHCFTEGENILYNVCELNHNKVQSDEWFCADGEAKT